MFSCKAAFTTRFFFHSMRTGDRPGHCTRFTRHTTSACRAFPQDSHFCVGLSLIVEPQAQGQIFLRVALKLQRRTELLVQRNARLVEEPATGCSFFDPEMFFPDRALGLSCFRLQQVFFRPPSFSQPRKLRKFRACRHRADRKNLNDRAIAAVIL